MSRGIETEGNTMNDKKLGTTLFPIKGLPNEPFRLRVLKVREHVPQDSQTPVRLSKWATILWKNELKQAVVPAPRSGVAAFLTPDTEACPVGQIYTLDEDVPDQKYSVEVTSETINVEPRTAAKEELQVAAEMLKRSISDAFMKAASRFWRKQWNLFFRVLPENYDTQKEEVYAYRGMKFAVIFIDAQPLFAADVVTTYRSILSLAGHPENEWEDKLYYHVSGQVVLDDRDYFLRDNGANKIPCQFVSSTGESVSQYWLTLGDERKTVRQYYADRYRIDVPSADKVVFVRDRGSPEKWPVPASRLFPMFKTDSDEMSGCSVAPFLSPAERLRSIQGFISDLPAISFSGSRITIETKPYETHRSYFVAPALEFRDEAILKLDESLPIERAFSEYRQGKRDMLYQHGTFSEQSLADLILFYPETLPRQVRETFQKQLNSEIKEISGSTPRVARQIEYRLGNQPASGAGLLKAVEDFLKNPVDKFLPLVVLAEPFRDRVYDLLKQRLRSNPSQCVTERTVKKIVNDQRAVGGSRLRNLALAILTAGGIQPWVLAEPLNYDFYMGVDLLFSQVIYVFVCGKGGRNVWVRRGMPRPRHFIKEKIDEFELADRFAEAVREAKQLGVDVKSVVIHRDGRWWSNEDQALTNAITDLQSDNTLPADCKVAVVEVHKSHLPVRLFTITNNASQPFENPIPGSFLKLNSSEILLTSTGQPGPWDRQNRTARTLLLRLVRGEAGGAVDIEKIAADAYGLTHLNWNAPEIEISLPVTIRWSDERLKEIIRNSGVNEALETEEQEAAV
jgi:hypothetical protein